MSAGSILSLGFGSFSDINHVVTLGYTPGIGLAAVVPPAADVVTIIPPPRAPVDFVLNGGYLAGVHVPRFRKVNKMIKGPLPRQPEDVELREMMGLFAMWKRAA